MMQTPSADAKRRNNQFSIIFPSLQETPIQQIPPKTDIAEFLARLLQLQSIIQPPCRTGGQEKKYKDTPAEDNRFGIATHEVKALLQMCGKSTGGTFDYLPMWFQQDGKEGL